MVTDISSAVGRLHVPHKLMGIVVKYAYGLSFITRWLQTKPSLENSFKGAIAYVTVLCEEGQFVTPLLHEGLKPLRSWLTKHKSNLSVKVMTYDFNKIESGASV